MTMTTYLRGIGRSFSRHLPPFAAQLLRIVYHRMLIPPTYARHARDDEKSATELGIAWPPPPPHLRHRVHGSADLASFVQSGRAILLRLVAGLRAAGMHINGTESVLDFGCGCGRMASQWLARWPDTGYTGCDIDGEAVGWAEQHIASARFDHTPFLPPLPYADDSFDLVIAISVFTHLDEVHQDAWLAELERVVRRGGMLALSVHNDRAGSRLSRAMVKRRDATGILFVRDRLMRGLLPEFYQTTYHAKWYVEAHWGSRFDIVGVADIGLQDAVILRPRKSEGAVAKVD